MTHEKLEMEKMIEIYLFMSNLHVEHDVVHQVRKARFDCDPKFRAFHKSVDKFKNGKNQIFETQDFTIRIHYLILRESIHFEKNSHKNRNFKIYLIFVTGIVNHVFKIFVSA